MLVAGGFRVRSSQGLLCEDQVPRAVALPSERGARLDDRPQELPEAIGPRWDAPVFELGADL